MPPNAIPPRGLRLYRLDEPIRCALGHTFSETAGHVEHGWLRCTKSLPARDGVSGKCGEFVYVRQFGNGWVGVARIDWREAYHVQRLQMSVEQAAEFLQLDWRGAA